MTWRAPGARGLRRRSEALPLQGLRKDNEEPESTASGVDGISPERDCLKAGTEEPMRKRPLSEVAGPGRKGSGTKTAGAWMRRAARRKRRAEVSRVQHRPCHNTKHLVACSSCFSPVFEGKHSMFNAKSALFGGRPIISDQTYASKAATSTLKTSEKPRSNVRPSGGKGSKQPLPKTDSKEPEQDMLLPQRPSFAFPLPASRS